MIKNLKTKILTSAIALTSLTEKAVAQQPVPQPNLTNPLEADSLLDLIAVDIPRFLITYLVGPLTILFFMINAATLLFSAPNPEQAAKAKTGIFWSIAGFVLAISSLAIVRFIESVIQG